MDSFGILDVQGYLSTYFVMLFVAWLLLGLLGHMLFNMIDHGI